MYAMLLAGSLLNGHLSGCCLSFEASGNHRTIGGVIKDPVIGQAAAFHAATAPHLLPALKAEKRERASVGPRSCGPRAVGDGGTRRRAASRRMRGAAFGRTRARRSNMSRMYRLITLILMGLSASSQENVNACVDERYCDCYNSEHPSWNIVNCTLPLTVKLFIRYDYLSERTTRIIIHGGAAVYFEKNSLSRLNALKSIEVRDTQAISLHSSASFRQNLSNLSLDIDGCNLLELEPKAFAYINGPLSVSVKNCKVVTFGTQAFSWLLDLYVENVTKLTLYPNTFALDPTADNIGDHGPGMTIEFMDVILPEIPAQAFAASTALIRMEAVRIEIIRLGAFTANTCNVMYVINCLVKNIEKQAFAPYSLINSLNVHQSVIERISSNAVQSAIGTLSLSNNRFHIIETGAINGTVASLTLEKNVFKIFNEKGFVLSSCNKYYIDRNVFDELPPYAITAPGSTPQELTFISNEIETLSVHEYSERHRLNEPRALDMIQEIALPNIYTEEMVRTDEKNTQTMPEELTKELLEDLKKQLTNPQNYGEARQMIEHLYDLINAEEKLLENSQRRPNVEENIYELPYQQTVPRIGRNKKRMISVGTKIPSLEKLLPLSPYTRQTALAHEYFQPKDFAVHLYAEIANCNRDKMLLGAIPDVLAEQAVPRGPYLRAVHDKMNASSSAGSSSRPAIAIISNPQHMSTIKSNKSTASNSSAKMLNRPLPQKPDEAQDPGEANEEVGVCWTPRKARNGRTGSDVQAEWVPWGAGPGTGIASGERRVAKVSLAHLAACGSRVRRAGASSARADRTAACVSAKGACSNAFAPTHTSPGCSS
ncbi:unnamed protein product, partial [Iphiclides podalirius]